METKEKEIWREVPNYEGYYEASNMGRVRSLDRWVVNSRGQERFYKGRILEGTVHKGYRRFALSIDNKSRTFSAAQISAIAFLSHIPAGNTLVVDHIDGDKSNDRLENLRVVSSRENVTTCFRSDRDSLTSKHAGVHWHKPNNKWCAHIRYEDKQVHLGYYSTEIDASNAYQKALGEINDNSFNPDEYKPKWSSSHKGVYFNKRRNRWRSSVPINNKQKHLGYFNTELEAYEALQKALSEINNGTFNPDDYKPSFTSKYKGVHFQKTSNKWRAQVYVNNKQKHLGYFNTEIEAYETIQKALSEVSNGTFNINDYKPVYTSRYKGVGFHKKSNKWRSRVRVNKKYKYVGLYPTELEAYSAIQKFKQEVKKH